MRQLNISDMSLPIDTRCPSYATYLPSEWVIKALLFVAYTEAMLLCSL